VNYLNLNISKMEDRAGASAETLDIGIWVRLLKYCGKVENGGRITGAALWKSCEWIRVVGITKDEFHREAPGLWKIIGDDVLVHDYPIEQEEKVKANRLNGRRGGRPADPNKPHGKPDAPPRAKGKRKRKRKENTTTRDGEILVHPDDLDEYGPAPASPYPDAHPRWAEFVDNREAFERFDAYRERTKATGPPARN
jgi:hypothetical protein